MFMDDEFPITMEREAGMRDDCPPVGVAFGLYYEQNQAKSDEAGHPVFDDVVFVKIVVPGDKNSLYFQPATDKHKSRFPNAYAAFEKRKGGEAVEGMPIEQWAVVTRGMAMTLKAAHIHTVEALAAVHDGHVDRIGVDGRGLRAKAQAFLAQAKNSAETTRLAAREKELQDQLAAMQATINQLAAAQGVKAEVAPVLETVGAPDPVAAARKPRAQTVRKPA